MENKVMLTTIDNPFNPFTDFKQWYSYDIQMGYNTCERLASIVNSLPESLTQEENNYFVNEAIDELIKSGCYSKFGQFVEYKKLIRDSKD